MARTVRDTLNRITPTDTAQMLGRLQFGDVLFYYFKPTLDDADRTVTAHVCEPVDGSTALPGTVISVHATAGGAPGAKAIILTGAPAAGQVKLEYNHPSGQPKLTFAAADAITGCRLYWIQHPIRSTKGLSMRAEMDADAP